MTTKNEDETGIQAFRYLAFDGTQDKWLEWSIKMKAVGKRLGWWSELEAETAIKDEKDEDKKKEQEEINNRAYEYLQMACTGDISPGTAQKRMKKQGCLWDVWSQLRRE